MANTQQQAAAGGASASPTSWQAGDRVYLVASPEITGTVARTLGSRVTVDLDVQGHGLGFILVAPDEIEWYTLPAPAGLAPDERASLIQACDGRGVFFLHELQAMSDSRLIFSAFPFMGNTTDCAWSRDMQARGLAPAEVARG